MEHTQHHCCLHCPLVTTMNNNFDHDYMNIIIQHKIEQKKTTNKQNQYRGDEIVGDLLPSRLDTSCTDPLQTIIIIK